MTYFDKKKGREEEEIGIRMRREGKGIFVHSHAILLI